jgi:hypothetical protein
MTAAVAVVALLTPGPGSLPCNLVSPHQAAQSLEYERRGEARSDYGNESDERVWLRLRNNTSCLIRIPAAAPVLIRKGPDGRPTADLPDGQEVAMEVWVTDPGTGQQFVHPGGCVRSERTLPAGQSVTFSVAANLLKRGPIVVRFEYQWDQRGTVEHRLRLDPSELPEDVTTWLKGVKDPAERAYLSPAHAGRRLGGAPAHPTPEPSPKPRR